MTIYHHEHPIDPKLIHSDSSLFVVNSESVRHLLQYCAPTPEAFPPIRLLQTKVESLKSFSQSAIENLADGKKRQVPSFFLISLYASKRTEAGISTLTFIVIALFYEL